MEFRLADSLKPITLLPVKRDMLDSWQILGVDEGRRLDLLFNMKASGGWSSTSCRRSRG